MCDNHRVISSGAYTMTRKSQRRFRIIAIVCVILASVTWIHYEPPLSRDALRAYQSNASRFIEIGDLSVHYRREGNVRGPTVVLVHGTAASLHTWEGWVGALASDYDVVSLDLPAYGLTGARPDRDYSIEAYVEFLDAFVLALGIERFTLAGNSLGGRISWQYALDHSEKLDALVLIDPSGFMHNNPPSLAFRLANMPLINKAIPLFAPRSIYEKSVYEVYGDDSKVTDALIERYYQLSLFGGNRQAFVDGARTKRTEKTHLLSNIKTPTLILWGEEDRWIPASDAQRFAAAIQSSRVIMYPGVGHVPMEEIPLQTVADVIAFIESLKLVDVPELQDAAP
ncbi:MAG: alpha/beta hydrolase [Pseudomonadota bacterium]